MIPLRSILAASGLSLVLLAGCEGESLPLVHDRAGIMTEMQRQELSLHHQFLLLDYDIDYRVVTSPNAGDVDLAALDLFETLSAGAQSGSGRGLLLLIDNGQQEVRLEVGYALEGVFPDAFVAYVEQRQMVPFFQDGRMADGILASTELIVDRADRASRNASWDDEIWMKGSGGAGARSSTRTVPGFETTPPSGALHALPASGRSPADIVALYLDAMRRRDADSRLDIYTAETRELLAEWLVTPAQMDQVARTYARCTQPEERRGGGNNLAVIRYPIEQRGCAPWFLRRGSDGWKLDLTMQQEVIRFGRGNAWHFDLGRPHPYEFAFEDWVLDGSGFPVSRK